MSTIRNAAIASAVTLAVSAVPVAAHPNIDVSGSLGCETATFQVAGVDAAGPVTFDSRVTRDGVEVASGTFTLGAPGGESTLAWPVEPLGTHDYAAYLSWEGKPETQVAAATLTCGTPPPSSLAPAAAPGPLAPPLPATPQAAVAAQPARLVLRKTAPARVRRGARILYRLRVTNTGTVAARNVVVRDPIPAGAYAGVLSGRARLSGGAVVWRLGTIAPGARLTVRLTLRTRPTATGRILNVAWASAVNAAKVHAGARTGLVLPARVRPARVQPAVTG